MDQTQANSLSQGRPLCAVRCPGGDVAHSHQAEGAGARLTLRSIRAEHGTEGEKTVTLPFDEESDGTRRLTHLLPALFQLRSEKKVYVIDEIDRSLHPLLSRKFIEFFLHACKGNGRQIIVTTHESNLMDLSLLRRDELWFTEKDHEGATSLYSLSDFKVRTDLKIDKGYLYGRFGAIPFLGKRHNPRPKHHDRHRLEDKPRPWPGYFPPLRNWPFFTRRVGAGRAADQGI
jgi:hypothetical protein